ncbi:MAG: integrase [Desulfuromonadales bacterium C00003094]|nr:MAG: integrase [Desulfuromonadales bacterium C00003094]
MLVKNVNQERTHRVHKLLDDADLEGFLFLDRANLRYLSGFSGSAGALLVSRKGATFLTDARYTTQARQEVHAQNICEYRVQLDGILEQVNQLGLQRIGFEADSLPYAMVERLRKKSPHGCQWLPEAERLRSLRWSKDRDELSALEHAAVISAEAFEEILPLIRPGVVEREVALELEFAMRRRGAEEKSFDTIVASGQRGALPHGVASDKVIASGDLVTIDFGARWNGYHSDETVTVAVGPVSAKLRQIFDIVLEAHDRAIDAVRPGVPLRDIDAIARSYIREHGYGDYFGHSLGHGVGLEVHEHPAVSAQTEVLAEEGMVITIEPGIYIPDLGGVRIEDMVYVTADGHRRITRLPKKFRLLPA